MRTQTNKTIALLSATMLAAAPVALATTALTVALAEPVAAKNGNGNGNGGGNGGGRGNSSAAKDRSEASARGNGKGNGGGNGNARRGGGGGLLEALGLQKRRVVVVREAPKTRTSAPARTQAASAEPTERYGNSWKSRIDGDLKTPASELGSWNSAKRSPVAIANMAAKVRETGVATGAGGAIGALVVAYEDYNTATTTYQTALDDAIAREVIDRETANRLIEGSLSEEGLAMSLAAIETDADVLLTYDDAAGAYTCEDGGSGACSEVSGADLEALADDRMLLDDITTDPALSAAIEDYTAADDSLEEANSTVQPNKSTDPLVQEHMLADVLDLLDLEADPLVIYEIPEEEIVEEETTDG